MHYLGKILAFLVVFSAIAASLLTAKLIQVRNSWTAKAAAAKAKFVDTQPKIDALEVKIESLKNELFRSRELWGSFWQKVQTTVNPADGAVTIGIGSDVGVRPAMLLHGFEIAADGSAVYRGSFLVGDVQKDSSSLKPNFRATPEDVKNWPPTGLWRWRNSLPPGYMETFDRQLLSILKDEETLRARTITLDGQKQMLVKANSTLKQREAELVGGEGLAKGDSVGPEFRDGLVSAVEQTEEERNMVLLKLDGLRRKVREVQADNERLQAENQGLIQRLPEPQPRNAVTQNK